jgi:RNA polymerase sigma factor (sigma-70 family)
MKDDHLAEDIVQDALLRAFLKLGTLVDDNRFLPWFHRIVRTQAWMKLRRGGWYRRETSFSELSVLMENAESKFGHGDHVDRVLFHLQERTAERTKCSRDPAEVIVRKETFDAIMELLGCLRRKERAIFEAYFFVELTPKEIAALFATTPANNSISRTKAKLQKERLRIYVNGYVEQRRKRGLLVRKILDSSKIHF